MKRKLVGSNAEELVKWLSPGPTGRWVNKEYFETVRDFRRMLANNPDDFIKHPYWCGEASERIKEVLEIIEWCLANMPACLCRAYLRQEAAGIRWEAYARLRLDPCEPAPTEDELLGRDYILLSLHMPRVDVFASEDEGLRRTGDSWL